MNSIQVPWWAWLVCLVVVVLLVVGVAFVVVQFPAVGSVLGKAFLGGVVLVSLLFLFLTM